MAIIYYFLGFSFYFLGLLEIFLSKRKDKLFLYSIAFLILLFFVGLKINGGSDFASYHNIYDRTVVDVNAELSSGLIEPLFVFLMLFVHFFGGNFFVFHFFVALVNFSIKITVFKKLVPYLFPALLIYLVGLFFERDNDGIRQGFSIAFCYLSLPYLLSNRKLPYLFFNIVAFLIHYSSVIFLVSYFFPKIRLSDKKIAVFVFGALIFSFLNLSFIDIFIKFVPISAVVLKLSLYAESTEFSADMGINIGMVFRIIILFLFIYFHRSLKISQDVYYLLRNGFAFAIISSLLFSDFAILAHRLPYAFREFQIFIIPYFLTIAANKANQVVILSIIFCYSLIIMFRFLNGDGANFYLSYDNAIFHLFD